MWRTTATTFVSGAGLSPKRFPPLFTSPKQTQSIRIAGQRRPEHAWRRRPEHQGQSGGCGDRSMQGVGCDDRSMQGGGCDVRSSGYGAQGGAVRWRVDARWWRLWWTEIVCGGVNSQDGGSANEPFFYRELVLDNVNFFLWLVCICRLFVKNSWCSEITRQWQETAWFQLSLFHVYLL
jgi:hypothetical protein